MLLHQPLWCDHGTPRRSCFSWRVFLRHSQSRAFSSGSWWYDQKRQKRILEVFTTAQKKNTKVFWGEDIFGTLLGTFFGFWHGVPVKFRCFLHCKLTWWDAKPSFLLETHLRIQEWVHPGRLTWNIIMEVWKIIFLSKWVMEVGSMLIFQGVSALPALFSAKNGLLEIPRSHIVWIADHRMNTWVSWFYPWHIFHHYICKNTLICLGYYMPEIACISISNTYAHQISASISRFWHAWMIRTKSWMS